MDYVLDLLPVITRIINMSLAFGHVPASMKTALVTPLIKKPSLDKEVLQNYQPVPNLVFLFKVLERVVFGGQRIPDCELPTRATPVHI